MNAVAVQNAPHKCDFRNYYYYNYNKWNVKHCTSWGCFTVCLIISTKIPKKMERNLLQLQSITFIHDVIKKRKKEIIERGSNPRPLALYKRFFICSFVTWFSEKKKKDQDLNLQGQLALYKSSFVHLFVCSFSCHYMKWSLAWLASIVLNIIVII